MAAKKKRKVKKKSGKPNNVGSPGPGAYSPNYPGTIGGDVRIQSVRQGTAAPSSLPGATLGSRRGDVFKVKNTDSPGPIYDRPMSPFDPDYVKKTGKGLKFSTDHRVPKQKEGPGPGHYDIDKGCSMIGKGPIGVADSKYTPFFGGGKGHILPGEDWASRLTSDNPAPGSYNAKKSQFEKDSTPEKKYRQPGVTMRGRYEVTKDPHSPWKSTIYSPGPAHYSPPLSTASSKGAYIGLPRQEESGRHATPGPGAYGSLETYSAMNSPLFANSPAFSMRPKTSDPLNPGNASRRKTGRAQPSQYHPDRVLRPSTSPNIGREGGRKGRGGSPSSPLSPEVLPRRAATPSGGFHRPPMLHIDHADDFDPDSPHTRSKSAPPGERGLRNSREKPKRLVSTPQPGSAAALRLQDQGGAFDAPVMPRRTKEQDEFWRAWSPPARATTLKDPGYTRTAKKAEATHKTEDASMNAAEAKLRTYRPQSRSLARLRRDIAKNPPVNRRRDPVTQQYIENLGEVEEGTVVKKSRLTNFEKLMKSNEKRAASKEPTGVLPQDILVSKLRDRKQG